MIEIRTVKALILLAICCPIWWAAVVLSAQNPQHVPPFVAQYGDFTLGDKLNGVWPAAGACKVGTGNPASPWTYGLCNGASFPVPVTIANGGTGGITLTAAQINLMGMRFAAALQTGGGNNGIANAAATGYPFVLADPSYSTVEQYTFRNNIPNMPINFHFHDLRSGRQTDLFHNWLLGNFGSNENPARFSPCLLDGFPTSTATTSMVQSCEGAEIISSTPGWSFGNPPAGVSGWHVPKGYSIGSYIYGSGIAETVSHWMWKPGTGDTVADYFYSNGEAGWTAPSDEGTKAFGANTVEDPFKLVATCSTGCSTGSTSIKVTTPTLISKGHCTDEGNADCAFGVGRYLIDTTAGPQQTTTVTGMATGVGAATAVTVTGTVPVSNAWGTLAGTCGPATPAQNITVPPFTANYTCNVNVTSGTFDTSHLLCLSMSQFHECVIPSAVGTPSGGVQSVTMALRKPHSSTGVIFQGGMAGYGLEFTSNTFTVSGQVLRYLFDIAGSTDANTLQVFKYKQGVPEQITFASGITAQNIYGFVNLSTLSNSGTTVSATFVSAGSTLFNPAEFQLKTWVISGASDTAFNAACSNWTFTDSVHFTCTIAGLSGTHTATTATANLGNDSVKLWPMAEVIDVQNEALTPPTIDGTMSLEPNIVAFSAGHTVEETHHSAAHFEGVTILLNAYNPYNVGQGLHVSLQGQVAQGGGGSTTGNGVLTLTNNNLDSLYQGMGGWAVAPNLINLSGAYTQGINFDHGPANFQTSVINMNMPASQRNDINYSFGMWNIAGRINSFKMQYTPYTGAWALSTGGQASYSASSHLFVGPVTLPASSTLAGKTPTGAGAALPTGPTSTTAATHVCFSDTAGTLGPCSSSIVSIQVTTGTSAVPANTCSADLGPVTMTGVDTTKFPTFEFTATGDTAAIVGWGSTGGLVLAPWPASNAVHYKICNQTGSSITPGSVTWNVSAKQNP